MAALPDPLPIATRGPLAARVRVPGSKSITNRALLIAALAEGTSQLRGALESDDTVVMRRGLGQLGCAIETRGDGLRAGVPEVGQQRRDSILVVGRAGGTVFRAWLAND